MITVSQAETILHDTQRNWGTIAIPLELSNGRILQETLTTDRDMPPFHRITMDGIAMNYDVWVSGIREYKIEGIAAAGSAQLTLENEDNCLEVMTGAMLPIGCDTVIRYEDLEIQDGSARILLSELKQGVNIHRQGSDRSKGTTIVNPGVRINPGIINIAATLGLNQIQVAQLPKVLLFSTGDELVPVASTPLAHQIRRSNVHMVKSALSQLGIIADEHHINDDQLKISEKLAEVVNEYDIIILSGGVSMGKYDFIPKTMQGIGIKQKFHKVQQRPGKPLWFGAIENGVVVFGLPGNPASSLACTCRYIIPWLYQCMGARETMLPMAILGEDTQFSKPLTYFLQVRLENLDGKLIAFPEEGNGSGDLANLGVANGFLELPQERKQFYKGERYPIYRFG